MVSFLRYLLPSCVVILLGGGALWAATDGFRALTEESARRLHVAENRPLMPSLVLEDMNGDKLTLGRETGTAGKITLVEFIYTTCPTICQAAGSHYARLRDQLARAGLSYRVRLLSVSFDPLQDTPRQMREYAENHGAAGGIWTIARISPPDIDLMKRGFGLRVIADELGGYQHNAAIHLVDRGGRLSGIFKIDDVDDVFRAVQGMLK